MKIFKSYNIKAKFNASGRTDKGVHSFNQVIDIDIPEFWNDLHKLKFFLNRKALPHIFIKKIEKADDSFHARYFARRRVYRYIISTDQPLVFLTPYVTYVNDIDENVIKKSIVLFQGTHNFEYFKKSGSDKRNFVRTIYHARFYKYKNFYIFYFEANGFLRSQIRMMVGFLLKISNKKLTQENLISQLNREKVYSTHLALPNGLYLSKIKY